MAGKSAAKSDGQQVLRITKAEETTRERQLADVSLDAAANALCTVQAFNKGSFGKTEVTETYEALRDSIDKVREGKLGGPESMLAAQAHSLNAIFTELARRSACNMGEFIEASDKYMRMALKAQAQCRATIETLAAIKNPPLVIAKQANIANGPQQVNNGPAPAPRAEEQDNRPNELLETDHGKRLDPGAPGAASASDPALDAVEAVDRAA